MKENHSSISLSPLIKIATIQRDTGLKELSGQIATARQNEFWGFNDKNNDPELFRFRPNGSVIQTIKLDSIKNDDWEAIARYSDGSLLIGGVGDNNRKKDDYEIHQIKEPGPSTTIIKKVESYKFTYPDKQSHNCEAMFVMGDAIYLITKDEPSPEAKTQIYRVDSLKKRGKSNAKLVGALHAPGAVTGAAYDEDKNLLAVLTYSHIHLFKIATDKDMLSPPAFSMAIQLGQCEGVCFYRDELIISNEDGELWAAKIEMNET